MKNKQLIAVQLIAVVLTCLLSNMIFAAEFVVTRTDDPVPQSCSATSCSLREAVIAANNNPGEDVVLLNTAEYVLSLVDTGNKFLAGDLDVLDTLVIRHAEPINHNDRFTILGNMHERVIHIHPDSNLTLKNAIVTGGSTTGPGGGILVGARAMLIIESSQISSNEASQGGALHIQNSQVQMSSVSVIDNHVTDNGGGVLVLGDSQLVMDKVNITGNTAQKGGGGLYFGYLNEVNVQPDIHIENSFFGDNRAFYGGALNAQGSFGEVTGSTLIENTDFVLNQAEKWGGGIFHLETDLMIKNSLFQLNQVESEDPTIFSEGGAIYSGTVAEAAELVIERSLFDRNWAEDNGGGLHLEDNNTTITNTTFSDNTGGVHAAINAISGDLSLSHVTVVNNDMADDIDVFIGSNVSGDLQNSIIRGRCQFISFTGFQSLGGNIESPGDSCDFGAGVNDMVGVAPRFLKLEDGLADNGGPTPTHAIRYDDSLAVGNAVPINGISHDQRHMSRDAMPDSGAFEVHDSDLILIFKDGFE